MKKLDKLVLKSFWGPFMVTLSVVIFIFLMKVVIFYIDDFVSKDVALLDIGILFSYFALSTVPMALPLALLLASLMTYGNLGEFFELTAIKSAGISMTRVMVPMFVIALLVSATSFLFNDRIAPWANLKAYSMLYDIREAKPIMKIKEGIFYNDLPGYSIKVDKKMPDGNTMLGMVIYKHDSRAYERGNSEVILADSGRMYTINDNSYLVFELFNGNNYQEVSDGLSSSSRTSYTSAAPSANESGSFMRNSFDNYKLVISLSSFGIKKSDEEAFKYHAYMKNVQELSVAADSVKRDYDATKKNLYPTSKQYFTYSFKTEDSTYLRNVEGGAWVDSLLAVTPSDSLQKTILEAARSSAESMASFATSNASFLKTKLKDGNVYSLERQKKFAGALSCLILVLIGAPLGAIIKKGGFGLPVLISIIFYILMYVLNIQGEKYVKEGGLDVTVGIWMSNFVLLLFGLYFTDRARNDSRLFDKDVYVMLLNRIRARWGKPQVMEPATELAESS
jgi:lipopolysaccharide export system permease protein